MSEALYRKYRPQTFAEVVGQDAVCRTLRNSVFRGKLAHAYLFSGPKGTGKTSIGRLIAKAALCVALAQRKPCNECNACRRLSLRNPHHDFIELNAATYRGIDMAREMEVRVYLTPWESQYKVYLLDEFHMVTSPAQNALLRVLEEPPSHILFVLTTTEPSRLEDTIISRCIHFDLKPIPPRAMVPRLRFICEAEGYTLAESSLERVARAASGDLRKALGELEKVVSNLDAVVSDQGGLWTDGDEIMAVKEVLQTPQADSAPTPTGKRTKPRPLPGPRQHGRPSKLGLRQQALDNVLGDGRWHDWTEIQDEAERLGVRDAGAMRRLIEEREQEGHIEVERDGRGVRRLRISPN